MAKNNERNLNVTIKNQDDKKSELIISISAIMKNLKKYLAVWLVIAIIAGLLTFCYSAYKTFSAKNPTKALVSFTYKGIEQGLDPKGRKFEIDSMKNPKVIEKALTQMGLDLDKIEDIRSSLSFDYKIPQEAYDQLTAYNSVMDKATTGSLSAAQAMLDTKYYPTQFTVHFDFGRAGFDRQTGVDFLNTLLKCYGDYFYEEYGFNKPLGTAVKTADYESYDYAQQIDLFRISLRTVKNYLDDLAKDDTTLFRSSVTGYSFNDLSDYAKTITSIDLDKISSYIAVNNVTKNKDSALAYYNYRIENLNFDKNEYTERIEAIEKSIAAYEKDVVQVFGNNMDETEQKKTLHSDQYDGLFKTKTSLEASLAQTKQDINFYTSRRDALQNNKASSKANVDKVEADLAELNKKVSNLVDLTEQTASDYYENVQFANAYNILVPATRSVGAGLGQAASEAVKSIVIIEMLILVIYIAVAFLSALKLDNGKKKLAKAGSDDDDDDDDDEEVDLEELVDVIEEEAGKAEKSVKQTNSKKNRKK